MALTNTLPERIAFSVKYLYRFGSFYDGVSGWKWKNDALARRRASLLIYFMALFLSKNPFFQIF